MSRYDIVNEVYCKTSCFCEAISFYFCHCAIAVRALRFTHGSNAHRNLFAFHESKASKIFVVFLTTLASKKLSKYDVPLV